MLAATSSVACSIGLWHPQYRVTVRAKCPRVLGRSYSLGRDMVLSEVTSISGTKRPLSPGRWDMARSRSTAAMWVYR